MQNTHPTMIGVVFLALAWVFPLQPAWADSAADSYQMSVVLDRAHGDIVSSGQYQKAILRISNRHTRFPYASATNLCVAHTMVGQFKHAEHYCDEALVEAEKAAARGHRKGRDYTAEWAIAYSNRGVLRARMGNTAGAADDFRMAVELKAGTDAPMNNLSRLKRETAEPFVAK